MSPSDTTWRHRSGPTLAQVMVCYLPAPSHHLNQCWLTISKVLWHSTESITITKSEDIHNKTSLKIVFLKLHPGLPGNNKLRYSRGSAVQSHWRRNLIKEMGSLWMLHVLGSVKRLLPHEWLRFTRLNDWFSLNGRLQLFEITLAHLTRCFLW